LSGKGEKLKKSRDFMMGFLVVALKEPHPTPNILGLTLNKPNWSRRLTIDD
jgi:hypothetical protein